ncbi:hypothetical protein Tco_0508844 [Tanacetum coccineum]
MADHSQKWHDGSSSMNVGSSSNTDGLAAILSKLDDLGRDIKKLKENVHNQRASLKNLETQIEQLTKELHTRTTNEAPSSSMRVSFLSDTDLQGAQDEDVEQTKVLPCQLPPKELNPGIFTLPCVICNLNFNAIADLDHINPTLFAATLFEEEITTPKLKDLPSHLEYAFLDDNHEFTIIISSSLSHREKELLLKVLANHKGALAWKVFDIKDISPSFCTHKILMEDNFKLVVQPQHRLNPKVQDVVKAEIVKFLDAGLIYAIFDSPWISLIYVIPKEGGITVVTNKHNKLIPTRTVTGWRIPLAPKDQEKTTFTCPYGTFAYIRMPFGLCNALPHFNDV